MAAIPTIETNRLILSGPTSTDFDDLCAMWSHPDIVKGVGGVPLTSEDVWTRLLRYVGHWQLLGFGTWIARDKAGAYVGEVGFFDYRRVITPPPLELPEAGWAIARAAQRKGYATEAMQAVLAWGERHFGARPFSCFVDPDNEPSLRVAAKLGFREVRRATYKGAPVIVFRRDPR